MFSPDRIAQNSNLESVKIRPLSSYEENEPIKGAISDNAILHSDGRYEFIQHMVVQRNPPDSGEKFEPPAPGTYLEQEVSEVNPIHIARIVATYLERIVAEAEKYVVPECS